MTKLEIAISFIKSRLNRRSTLGNNPDGTGVTVSETEHLLSLLVTHDASEKNIQIDIADSDSWYIK